MRTRVWVERLTHLHIVADKYSFKIITSFQSCNDINKLETQGITLVRTNN